MTTYKQQPKIHPTCRTSKPITQHFHPIPNLNTFRRNAGGLFETLPELPFPFLEGRKQSIHKILLHVFSSPTLILQKILPMGGIHCLRQNPPLVLLFILPKLPNTIGHVHVLAPNMVDAKQAFLIRGSRTRQAFTHFRKHTIKSIYAKRKNLILTI